MNRVIAIDGPAGSGKSTISRHLAEALGWSFLDTGAMYRAVTALALRGGVSLDDVDAVASIARDSVIETIPKVTINGVDVSDEIRGEAVNQGVSLVAAMSPVREQMVFRQREWADRQAIGTVVEGRDIGSVVFPDATIKVFLTASLEERARRRSDEGVDSIIRRDQVDSSREASPLTILPDATVIDTTGRAVSEIVEEICQMLPE